MCVLSFGPCLFFVVHDFVFDDGAAVSRNDDVFNTNRTIFESFRKIITHDFWGQSLLDERSHKSYRPFVTMVFNLEFRYFNPEILACVMKRVNLLAHITTCCLIFEVFRKMFNDLHPSILLNSVILFAAHPIHTEVNIQFIFFSIDARPKLNAILILCIYYRSFVPLLAGQI